MGKGRQRKSALGPDLSQAPAFPVDEITEDPELQEAMDYLKSVREEARSIVVPSLLAVESGESVSEQVESPGDAEERDNSLSYSEFDRLINYKISERLLSIRRHPSYEKCKSEIIEYIRLQKEKASSLTEALQTEETISPHSWEDIIHSAQVPSIDLGKWNSYNWSSLLEYFAGQFEENPLETSIVNTNITLWIILALISLHVIDSFSPQVSYCMQIIKRFLESNDFLNLSQDDHFRIETIIIIIKYVYNQH